MVLDMAQAIISNLPRSFNLEQRILAQLPEGEEINARTRANMRFFEKNPELWINIRGNDDAQSCDDAAAKRGNLGNVGVPKHLELKTVGRIHKLPNGKSQIVLAHCAADENIDNAALKATLRTESKLSSFRTEAIPFGTFSPFLFDDQFIEEELKVHPFQVEKKGKWRDLDLAELDDEQPVLNVFSSALGISGHDSYVAVNKTSVSLGYMTTNFGHHNLGVQFRPYEATRAMEKSGDAIIGAITPDPWNSKLLQSREQEASQHKIGIITGNSSRLRTH